ncbi:hypothetical protein EYF80_045605 [Liparis tanakae]|uniref:Uncharacterized protein n=1 Tax=Liparis tanakae TaxID=230148 RepID=A0A4Z2FSP9_9TELE|nr:hypothetical protein EYF80_045605 [Liparis tanakae]
MPKNMPPLPTSHPTPLTSLLRLSAPGLVTSTVSPHATAASSTNTQSGSDSSAGSSTTSSPSLVPSTSTYAACSLRASARSTSAWLLRSASLARDAGIPRTTAWARDSAPVTRTDHHVKPTSLSALCEASAQQPGSPTTTTLPKLTPAPHPDFSDGRGPIKDPLFLLSRSTLRNLETSSLQSESLNEESEKEKNCPNSPERLESAVIMSNTTLRSTNTVPSRDVSSLEY